MKNKKLLFFIGIVIVILVLIIVSLFGQKKQTGGGGQATSAVGQTSVESKPVIEEKVYFPTISDDNLIYLAGDAQELRQVSLTDKNQKAIIYPINVPYIESINWSPDKTKAILKTNNQTTQEVKFYLYDLGKRELKPVNNAVAATAKWGDGNTLFYCQTNEANYNFNQFDFITGVAKKLFNLPERCDKVIAYQPDLQSVAYATIKSDVSADLNLFNFPTKQKNTLVSDNYLDAISSVNGNWILIQLNQEKNNIVTYNIVNKNKKDLGITSDLNKIIFLNQNEIIATIKENNGDVFYRVNLQTGAKQKLANQPEGSIDAENLNLSPDGKKLYFTNKNTFYQLKIK